MFLFIKRQNSKPDYFRISTYHHSPKWAWIFFKNTTSRRSPCHFFPKKSRGDRRTDREVNKIFTPEIFFFFFFKFLQIECSRLRSYIALMLRISVIAARSIFCITSSDRIAQYRMIPFFWNISFLGFVFLRDLYYSFLKLSRSDYAMIYIFYFSL